MSFADQPALFYEHPFTAMYPSQILGPAGAIVMSLLIDFIGKGYTVYVNNY